MGIIFRSCCRVGVGLEYNEHNVSDFWIFQCQNGGHITNLWTDAGSDEQRTFQCEKSKIFNFWIYKKVTCKNYAVNMRLWFQKTFQKTPKEKLVRSLLRAPDNCGRQDFIGWSPGEGTRARGQSNSWKNSAVKIFPKFGIFRWKATVSTHLEYFRTI